MINLAWASLEHDHLPSGRVYLEAFLSRWLLDTGGGVEERKLIHHSSPFEKKTLTLTLTLILIPWYV